MLKFLDWPLQDETRFAQDVEIVLLRQQIFERTDVVGALA